MTPQELLRYPCDSALPWRLRVFANKYPAFDDHEVILESPEHRNSFGELPASASVDLLCAVRDRMAAFRLDKKIAYVQFFKNNGPGSGASLAHPHSQIIALPMVPVEVRLELEGSQRHSTCPFCATMQCEERIVMANEEVVVLAPYAPRFGFETWVLPRRHLSHFEQTDARVRDGVALALHETVRRIEAVLDRSPYNLLLHTAPVREPGLSYYHWHIEILPRVSGIGGFEFGTGCYINTIMPEESASVLKFH